MKKFLLLFFAFATIASFGQAEKQTAFSKNEIKANALFFIIGQPEITYERILNNESSIGISTSFALEKDFETTFSVAPYYRYFFGKKPASGFFVEGFSMINSLKIDDSIYYMYVPSTNSYAEEIIKGDKYTDFALGFGLGFKLVSKKGLVLEANGGIGRNLLNPEKNDYFGHTFVGRGGITIGYRF
jgi:hypothetical protein